MADAERFGLARILQVFVPIVGVVVAGIGLFLTLAARKKEVSVSYLGSEKVVSVDAGGIHQEVRMEFRGQTIRSLYKMNFVLRNTGAAAVRVGDIEERITLAFPEGVNVLSSSVGNKEPADLFFEAIDMTEHRQVSLHVTLMNPGDEAYFAVYVWNSEPKQPEVRGRIVDVRRILSIDESASRTPNPFPLVSSLGVRRVLWWVLFLFNLGVGLLALSVMVAGLVTFLQYTRWARKWEPAYDAVLADIRKQAMEKLRAAGIKELQDSHYFMLSQLGSYSPDLAQALLKKGIPDKPSPMFENITDLLTGVLVFGVFFLLFSSTAVFLYLSPRGY